MGMDLSEMIAPPYDVITPAEQAVLYAQGAHNVVRLELPRAGATDPPGPEGEAARHRRAAQALLDWRRSGVLLEDSAPALYLYEQRFVRHTQVLVQRSLLAAVRLDPWEAGTIRRHEHTLTGPKVDRLGLLRATRANLSPIWSLYGDPAGEIEALLAPAWQRDPVAHAQDGAGIVHTLYRMDDSAAIAAVRAAFALRPLYIADGHHRYETALAYASEPGAPRDARAVLMLLTAAHAGSPLILPTHRLLLHLPPHRLEGLDERLGRSFAVHHAALPEDRAHWEAFVDSQLLSPDGAPRGGRFLLALQGAAEVLVLDLLPAVRAAQPQSPLAHLDVCLAHRLILEEQLGIDAASLARQEHVHYTRDGGAALEAAVRGDVQAALLLAFTPVEQLLAVADAGEVMPQKSTYFYPKPATGLVMRLLEHP
jgi:uncharacterized protein (DUF1015 family)